MRRLFFIFFILSLVSCEPRSKRNSRPQLASNPKEQLGQERFKKGYHRVYEVVDGDTFWVISEAGKEIKIRLIGIDAPETRNVFKKKKHPFGATSKQYLISMLESDSYVKLEYDVAMLDQFNRTLAYAYLADGTFINEKLVKEGYAMIMTVPPNIKYEQTFVNSQEYARQHKLGVWGIDLN